MRKTTFATASPSMSLNPRAAAGHRLEHAAAVAIDHRQDNQDHGAADSGHGHIART